MVCVAINAISFRAIPALIGVMLSLGLSAATLHGEETVVANYVVTVADDFVVDVYQNGKLVPDSSRQMLSETFGATAERINIEVHPHDWIVFHVVNNKLRWGGAYYFAAAGLLGKGELGFVSELKSGNWSSCDEPSDAAEFIIQRDYMSDHTARKITRPWSDGPKLMKHYAGDTWSGEPLWGRRRDTWLKFIVPEKITSFD
jgi:hypothetical protein